MSASPYPQMTTDELKAVVEAQPGTVQAQEALRELEDRRNATPPGVGRS
jgi:hypothetical protein